MELLLVLLVLCLFFNWQYLLNVLLVFITYSCFYEIGHSRDASTLSTQLIELLLLYGVKSILSHLDEKDLEISKLQKDFPNQKTQNSQIVESSETIQMLRRECSRLRAYAHHLEQENTDNWKLREVIQKIQIEKEELTKKVQIGESSTKTIQMLREESSRMTSYAQYLEKQNADLLTLREVVQIEKEELERKVSIRNSIIKRLKAVEKKFFSPKAIQSLTSDDPQQEDWKKRSLEKLTLEQLENLLNTAKKEKKKKLESEEEKKLCVVCLTAKRQVVCIPCYHICLCEGCSKKVKNMCPLDRQSVTFSKVYV
eukprot:TRINITY_DN5254_c0_g2_i1.p1 TRINITY_DN5254_c0_g2~~TRINITY_DN5254_c0_g2_i1.p1  ORF type:complete len:312 (-),score=86.23 TRINITY_DN5254_c0_g2_i1:39-974(-)